MLLRDLLRTEWGTGEEAGNGFLGPAALCDAGKHEMDRNNPLWEACGS